MDDGGVVFGTLVCVVCVADTGTSTGTGTGVMICRGLGIKH